MQPQGWRGLGASGVGEPPKTQDARGTETWVGAYTTARLRLALENRGVGILAHGLPMLRAAHGPAQHGQAFGAGGGDELLTQYLE